MEVFTRVFQFRRIQELGSALRIWVLSAVFLLSTGAVWGQTLSAALTGTYGTASSYDHGCSVHL